MKIPKVVVGIVTYNRSDLLRKTLDVIFNQDYPNFYIVVYDNGSIDNTQTLLQNYQNVINIKSEKNINIVDARNYLMSNYDGDYYFGLDDDAWPLMNNLISICVSYLENNPKVSVLGLDILSPSFKESLFKKKEPFLNSNFIACGCMLRKTVLGKVNYYSKSIGYYGPEEDDLSLKIMDLGNDVVTYPGLFIWHETSPKSRNLKEQWKSQVGNVLSIMVKHYPLILLMPIFIFRLMSLFIYSCKNGLFFVFCKGVIIFIKNLPDIIEQRKPLKYSTIIRFHKLIRQKK